jgi:hypothetical protein
MPRDWPQRFLGALREGASIAMAARFAGIARRTAYDKRDRDERFAAAWNEALEAGSLARIAKRTHRTNGQSDQLAARLRAVRYALERRGLAALAKELGEVERVLDRQARDRRRVWESNPGRATSTHSQRVTVSGAQVELATAAADDALIAEWGRMPGPEDLGPMPGPDDAVSGLSGSEDGR